MIGYIFSEIVTSFKGLNSKCMAAFEPIERFEDIDFELTNEKENELLEYVIMVANHFFPDYDIEYDTECKSPLPSLYTREFKAYYNQEDGLVYPVTVEEYIANESIQKRIEKYGIDTEKFWYLLLFVYNHCYYTYKVGYPLDKSSAREEFEKAMNYLKENFCYPSKKIRLKDYKARKHRDVSITIKKEGKEAITISHEDAISKLINWDAIIEGGNYVVATSKEPVDSGNRIFAYYFDKYINWFLGRDEYNHGRGDVKNKIYFIEDLLLLMKVVTEEEINPPTRYKYYDRFEWLRDLRSKTKGVTKTISSKFI